MFQRLRRHALKGQIILCWRNMTRLIAYRILSKLHVFKKNRDLKTRRLLNCSPSDILTDDWKLAQVQGLWFLFRKHSLLSRICLKSRVFLVSWSEDIVFVNVKRQINPSLFTFFANDFITLLCNIEVHSTISNNKGFTENITE